MTRPLVVVSARSFGTGAQDPQGLLESAGCDVERIAPSHDLDALSRARGWVAGTGRVTAEHLDAAQACGSSPATAWGWTTWTFRPRRSGALS